MGGHNTSVDQSGLERLTAAEAHALLAPHAVRFRDGHPLTGVEVDAVVLAGGGAALLPPGRYRDLVVRDGAAGGLFVRGDLIVDGVLELPFRAAPFWIDGNLRCDHLVTTAQLVVMGNVAVEGVFYGNSTNRDTVVYGDFRAAAIIREKNHQFAVFGATTSTLVLDDEEHGYEATRQWMQDRGVASHDEVALARVLRG